DPVSSARRMCLCQAKRAPAHKETVARRAGRAATGVARRARPAGLRMTSPGTGRSPVDACGLSVVSNRLSVVSNKVSVVANKSSVVSNRVSVVSNRGFGVAARTPVVANGSSVVSNRVSGVAAGKSVVANETFGVANKTPVAPDPNPVACARAPAASVLDFDENQRGQRIWLIARRENTRGQKGPWTDILSAIIP
ncbi:MAG: hypothetical protein LBK99_12485, partial [Opitutaceae bacterium]|nr:hypothetical protein [Opitutaceae bacterium]